MASQETKIIIQASLLPKALAMIVADYNQKVRCCVCEEDMEFTDDACGITDYLWDRYRQFTCPPCELAAGDVSWF